jgi:hypothetical protein
MCVVGERLLEGGLLILSLVVVVVAWNWRMSLLVIFAHFPGIVAHFSTADQIVERGRW